MVEPAGQKGDGAIEARRIDHAPGLGAVGPADPCTPRPPGRARRRQGYDDRADRSGGRWRHRIGDGIERRLDDRVSDLPGAGEPGHVLFVHLVDAQPQMLSCGMVRTGLPGVPQRAGG